MSNEKYVTFANVVDNLYNRYVESKGVLEIQTANKSLMPKLAALVNRVGLCETDAEKIMILRELAFYTALTIVELEHKEE